ncbi:uncharacterized protein NECHADRAFT_80728 [Fusarium vanettenii 77-13-4]|uniref:Ribosomal RNA methyltransferase FtsJ domain-containing protein n=1 Tax=Fusarium vanettenii (strain ATCC MYA-4622 / CBS 123669 / FGSC 9596 / NRRL 45880 / 77-13-4) TaxID=660122 RepID=C7YSG5_FUSV7|nr:uncharacterized protein NECHADRAFT_80728 [Fusarium vanettenii 77-13-4]EEU45632.1 hypothetical protein NECHADRAFT_80728 [Fusarium vanettenii 77-13-4]
MAFSFNPTAQDFHPVGSQSETPELPDLEHASMCDGAEISEVERGGQYAITAYLKENGWESSKGDAHFNKQRRVADEPTEKDARFFYNMMQKMGRDMNKATRAFDLSGVKKPALLDMCMAPGAFLVQILDKYPNAQVRAMSLPLKDGGHQVRLGHHNVAVEFRDITMLAADMSMQIEDVPASGPDPGNLEFAKVFSDSERFDLVLCDGAVRRTHQRTTWREGREATRLTITQLAIGLEHLNNGGTMADSISAKTLVLEWKKKYKVATVGADEEYSKIQKVSNHDAQAALDEFGKEFIVMGRKIWKLQAESLAKASFMKSEHGSQGKGDQSEGIGQKDRF